MEFTSFISTKHPKFSSTFQIHARSGLMYGRMKKSSHKGGERYD